MTAEPADLARHEAGGDLAAVIAGLRAAVAADRRIFTDPVVKAWCGRRWRHLFVAEATNDPVALAAATRRGDTRSPRQRIAERFLYEHVDAWRDEQPAPAEPRLGDVTFFVCPGLLNGILPQREFRDDLPGVAKRFGMRALRPASHPSRGCEANVADILAALREGKGADAAAQPIPDAEARPPSDVMAVCYSKGAPDTLTALVRHPEIAPRFRCLFTWAGATGGSQVADDIAARFKGLRLDGERALQLSLKLKGYAHWVMSPDRHARMRVSEFDTVGAIRDLTTGVRRAFLAEHAAFLDSLAIPFFTFRGVTTLGEAPLSQRRGWRMLDRAEGQNDMQLAGSASKLPFPMATELAVLHGHHWDLAYPSFRKRKWLNKTYHPFPRAAALTAMVQLAAELGLLE